MRIFICLIASVMPQLLGCAAEERGDGRWNTTQQRALEDPMNYRPEMDRSNISGGELHEFDRDGFKRDMDSLLLR